MWVGGRRWEVGGLCSEGRTVSHVEPSPLKACGERKARLGLPVGAHLVGSPPTGARW